MKKLSLTLLLLTASCFAQTPPQIYMFFLPATPASNVGFNNVFNANVMTGGLVTLEWSAVQNGVDNTTFNWSALDTTLIGNYTSGTYSTLKLAVISSPAKDISINPNPNTSTPSFVSGASQFYCSCGSYFGDGTNACTANAATQQGWPLPLDSTGGINTPFFTNYYGTYIPALFAHVQATIPGQVGYYVIGGSRGGEFFPTCVAQIQTALGISQAQVIIDWQAYVAAATASVAASAKAAGVTVPVYVSFACLNVTTPVTTPPGFTTNNLCGLANSEAASAVANGLGIRVTTPKTIDYALLAGGAPTIGNWGQIFPMYYGSPIDWQQGGLSDPTASATSAGSNCSPVSTSGSLAQLIPFMMQHIPPSSSQRVMEIYTQDLERNYGTSGPNQNNCWTNGDVGAYTNTFKNVLLGKPTGTTNAAGKTKKQGITKVQ